MKRLLWLGMLGAASSAGAGWLAPSTCSFPVNTVPFVTGSNSVVMDMGGCAFNNPTVPLETLIALNDVPCFCPTMDDMEGIVIYPLDRSLTLAQLQRMFP